MSIVGFEPTTADLIRFRSKPLSYIDDEGVLLYLNYCESPSHLEMEWLAMPLLMVWIPLPGRVDTSKLPLGRDDDGVRTRDLLRDRQAF